MTKNRIRTARRIIVWGTAAVALALATGLVLQQVQPDDTDDAAPAATLTVAEAERVELGDVVTLDGTVESAATVTVRHRIEGAAASTSSVDQQADPAGGQAPAGAQPATAQGFRTQTLSNTATTETTTPPPPTTPEPTAPESTIPEATTTSTPATSTPPPTCETTTTQPTTPESTSPTPQPSDCPEPTTSTTTPQTPPSSTVPSTGRTGGGGIPTGSPQGGAPTGGPADAATTGSAETLTERVTSIPAPGTTIGLGDVVYSVDGGPVIAMSGTLPQWRSLGSGSDAGIDIVQLESSLLALGYDDDGALVVDSEWDSATTSAVKAWQQGLGLEATGDVALGDIVFVPESSATVTAVYTSVGDDVTEQDPILDVTGPSQRVVTTVSDDAVPTITVGLPVQLDGSADEPIDATVTLMRSVTNDNGETVVEAIVTPNHGTTNQDAGSSIDVVVQVPSATSDAITIPADALVARLDGSYAVQVRDASGDHWEPVEILEIQGTKVAVVGVDVGTEVLVPE